MSDAILLYGDLDLNDNVTYFLVKEGFKYPSPALKQQYADSALKDGQLPTEAWKFDNRVLTFSIFVRGTDAATLDAALRALYMQVYAQDSTVTWCPAGRSTSFYFLAYRPEAVAVDSYFNTTRRSVNEAIVTWSTQAFPFGHTARRSLETVILSGSIVKLAAGQTDELLCMDGTTAVKDAIHNLAFTKTGGVANTWPGDSSNFLPVLGVSAPVIAQTTNNLLSDQNASLEGAGVGGHEAHWNCTSANSTAQAYHGTHSLAVTNTGDGGTSRLPVTAVIGNVQGTFSAKVKGPAGVSVCVQGGGDVSGDSAAVYIVLTGGWDSVKSTHTWAGDSVRYCQFTVWEAGAVVYWDAMQLETGAVATPFALDYRTGGYCRIANPLTPGGDASFVFCVNGPWAGNDGIAHYLLDMKGAGAGDVFSIYKHTDNKLYFTVGDKSAVTAALTATTWAANTNHIVIGTVTGGTINVYLAGTAGTPATGATREAALNANLYVGAKIDGTLPLNGAILCAIWGRVLTSEEIERFAL